MSDLHFAKWAVTLLGFYLVVGQAEPVKYAFKRTGPESICEWNNHYMPLLPLPWCPQSHNGMLKAAGVPPRYAPPNATQGVVMIDRRTFIAGAIVVVAGQPSCSRTALAQGAMSKISAYAFSFPALSGGDIRLAEFTGRPLLVVNTASQCGYTPQYAGLQQLWNEFRERGLVIIGVPSNDFGGQEPGGAKEIAETAQHHYGVTFPIAGKVVVKGPNAHPFYKWAAEARPKEVPRWNFHKYLVGREGYISEVFAESVEPTDTRVKTAIARALAAS